jgi:predicted esterase
MRSSARGAVLVVSLAAGCAPPAVPSPSESPAPKTHVEPDRLPGGPPPVPASEDSSLGETRSGSSAEPRSELRAQAAAPAPVRTPLPEPIPERLTFAVPGDRPIEVVLGSATSARAIVYLHGSCGDPLAFESWRQAAVAHATFISLRGDEKCTDRPGRSSWSFDYALLDRRILRAMDVVDAFRSDLVDSTPPVPLDRDDIVLIGYSQGAHRVQWMAARFPDRYRRVALIAISTEPSVARLSRAERVLLMAGGWDARSHIYDGHEALKKAGKTVRYLELPKARHGEYGPEAPSTMADGLDWLFK